MKKTALYSCIAAIVFVAGIYTAWGQGGQGGHEGHEPSGTKPEQLGQVSFHVSCNASAQDEFNRAMALFVSSGLNLA